MSAINSLWNSEKGLIAILLLIGSIVLAAMGKMPVADWISYSQIIFGVYVGGKTIQGAAAAIAGRPAAVAAPAAASVTGPSVAVVTNNAGPGPGA